MARFIYALALSSLLSPASPFAVLLTAPRTQLTSLGAERREVLATSVGATLASANLALPALASDTDETTRIKITLDNEGVSSSVTATLHKSWSPLGYDHFVKDLIASSYYDNSPIFRVIPNFVAQFGLNPDPSITQANSKVGVSDERSNEAL